MWKWKWNYLEAFYMLWLIVVWSRRFFQVTDAVEEKQSKNFIEQISVKSAEGDEKYLPSLLPQKGGVVMARNKSLTLPLQTSEDQSSEIIERNRRQVGPSSPSPLAEAEPTEELLVEEPKKGPRWRSHLTRPRVNCAGVYNPQATTV